MRSQLVIGQKHLNARGQVDAVSIQEALVTYQSNYLRENYDFTFEQFEHHFSVKLHTEEITVRRRRVVGLCGLNEVCTVVTDMVVHEELLTFKQSVIGSGDRELFTSLHVLGLTGPSGSSLSQALKALNALSRQPSEAVKG